MSTKKSSCDPDELAVAQDRPPLDVMAVGRSADSRTLVSGDAVITGVTIRT
jgi:hypothetical protein